MFDDVYSEKADFRETLVAKDAFILSIVESSCGSLGPSLTSLIENFHAFFNKSLSEPFRAGSIGSHSYTNTAIDFITFHSSKRAGLHGGNGSTKSKDVIDLSADH